MKGLSKTQKAKNRKKFGYENLKMSADEARLKLKELTKILVSKNLTTRQKLDAYIKVHQDISTDGISILKSPAKMGGFVHYPIYNSKIGFNTDHKKEVFQIWIPFNEWNKLGNDFENKYKEYIDWELINRYKQCKERK